MIKPFADDQGSSSIGDLTVENGSDVVVMSGNLEVTRDKAGLKHALALKQVADALVAELEGTGDLPEKVATTATATDEVANPFA